MLAHVIAQPSTAAVLNLGTCPHVYVPSLYVMIQTFVAVPGTLQWHCHEYDVRAYAAPTMMRTRLTAALMIAPQLVNSMHEHLARVRTHTQCATRISHETLHCDNVPRVREVDGRRRQIGKHVGDGGVESKLCGLEVIACVWGRLPRTRLVMSGGHGHGDDSKITLDTFASLLVCGKHCVIKGLSSL
jgi:hypothetical protein